MFSGKRAFDKRNLGAAPPGSKIVWPGAPGGPLLVIVGERPNKPKGVK